MFRRRRPNREIAFSFDSFLDVVANVVGIILRLILVAWVGARSYTAFVPPPPVEESAIEAADLPEPADPLSPELERQRQELARSQALLLEQLRAFEKAREARTGAARELDDLGARLADVAGRRAAVEGSVKGLGTAAWAALSLEELQTRSRRVADEIEALRRAPRSTRVLRYRTPISKPLQSEEWMFECRQGRVTLIDIGTLLEDVTRAVEGQKVALRDRGEVGGVTEAVGAFRLRWGAERQGGLTAVGTVRIGISWEAEPVDPGRGEAAEAALAAGSEFRRVVDNIDARSSAVTLWVYPDSFPLFRRLRDYLYDRDVVVAGRPVPEGMVIRGGPRGTASRGQ
jgi:hypothetical protein